MWQKDSHIDRLGYGDCYEITDEERQKQIEL